MDPEKDVDNRTLAQMVMVGIRDNLLKPMALEIENKTNDNFKLINQLLVEKSSTIEAVIKKLHQVQDVFQEELTKTTLDVKQLSQDLLSRAMLIENDINTLQQAHNSFQEQIAKAATEVKW